MTKAEAIGMIQYAVTKSAYPSLWLDLGAGTGVFTQALASQLGKNGIVHAIDKQNELSEKIKNRSDSAKIITTQLDFVTDEIPVRDVDGILMANSFHYVKHKSELVTKLKEILAPHGRFIFIEYDTSVSNPWVPYPIDFPTLRALMTEAGFSSIIKLHERPSIFNRAMMYSALVV